MPEERAKRLWSGMRTLSFRLAAWNAFVVLLTAVGILAMIREGVRYTLLNEMDEILLDDVEEIRLTLSEQHDFAVVDDYLQRKAEGHERHGWFVELSSPQTRNSWTTLKTTDAGPGNRQIPFDIPTSIDDYRVVRKRIGNSPQFQEILLGARLSFLKQAMSHIDSLVLMAFAATIILAPIIGYSLARRAAQTMGGMIRTAARLRPDHLAERLPVAGTGDELDDLAVTVNHLLDRIAEYVQLKRDFLANAAHELRTPLAAVRSSVEVALSGRPTADDYQELLADIMEQCTSLEMLVNQLLLLSETETSDLIGHARVCQFDQSVKRAIDMFAGVAEAGDVTLDLKRLDEIEVAGDRQHWRQVVTNLVDNAIKYTPAGGNVAVSLIHDSSLRTATFMVGDSGIGIPPQDLPRIFDRFFRADRARTHDPKRGGSGLGLAICKAIVEAHGGTIECQSVPNVGTTMTVIVPCQCCAHQDSDDEELRRDRKPVASSP